LPEGSYPGFFLQLNELAVQADKPFIRVNLGPTNPAVIAAKDLGAVDNGHYAWQIKICDVSGFLGAVTPVLEKRLEGSQFATYTGALDIDYYLKRISVLLNKGRVSGISCEESAAKEGGGDSGVRIPPNLISPLVLGQKSFSECAAFYPDCSANEKSRRLLAQLFPPMSGFFHCPY
jgi:hypothetical protein